ncbi:MAG: hypothetical protein IT582_11495 [Opitutaceae bacterium]|nr:hypothetical protein [Opitutaceae bacterium]
MNPTLPDPAADLLPHLLHRETELLNASIVHPSGQAWRSLADQLAEAIHRHTGAKPACHEDLALMPARDVPLPAELRRAPLIVLGSLVTNRALQPLYASYLCSTDATYPGGDGHDLRTIVNPYGTGANVVLCGGSSHIGVARAVELLIAKLGALPPRAPLPFLLEIELAPNLATQLATWPYTPLEDTAELQALRSRGLMFYTEPIRIIGAYTLMWSWTADDRYAHIAVNALRGLNASVTTGYGDWHYLAERFMRAIPLLIAGGFLTAEEIRRTDELLLLTALGNQDEWWRVKVGHPPLGHRHQGKGTYEFLLLVRYLRDQANPSEQLRRLCDRWIAECHAFLDALAAARICDQDDESSLNNIATIYRYALGEERHAFFTSGNSRLVAERCLALHDNNGNGAGQGGYGESQGMYLQQEATEQTACAAFYHHDGELKWILQTLPNLDISQRYTFLRYAPVFLQKYDTSPELRPVAPPAHRGVLCLPVTDHQFRISNHPPVHIEPRGHMINAPETWELPESVGLNTLPQALGFDKLVLRGGWSRADAYLLIQGYQGGFRWQGHMQAANCIVRFFQHGHVWLVQNTSRHSYHDKNGLLISDGANDTLMPPIAERVAVADFPTVALTVTRLNDCHHTDWTRHLFWSKATNRFVCLDHVAFKADGPYSLTCTWRTPAHATIDGRHWRSEQGRHRFTLAAGADYASTCEIDTDQGACSPYCLRQRHAGEFKTGDEFVFANLFQVRPVADPARIGLHQFDTHAACVWQDGQTVAWCGIKTTASTPWLPGAVVIAESVWVEADSIAVAHTRELRLPELSLHSNEPVTMSLDCRKGTWLLRSDTSISATITIDGTTTKVQINGEHSLTLPTSLCARIAANLNSWLESSGTIAAAEAAGTTGPVVRQRDENSPALPAIWRYDSGTRVPQILRSVRLTSNPLPINGSPDELLDPVLPDGYSRETWIQWPVAPQYTLDLALPEARPLTALNLLGDCIDDPTLRTFNPLPAGITVEVRRADGRVETRALQPGPDRPYKRYRDAENRLQVHTATLDGNIQSLQVTIPAPRDGRPFVLHRFEVLGDQLVTPALERWITADLDGDGRPEIVFTNARHELIVLDADGRERWRTQFHTNITHISAQPIDASGPPVLCVGLLGGDFLTYHTDGTPRSRWEVAQHMRARKDILQGWYNSAHCAAIWRRDAAGRGWLVLGGYAILVFLNPDGEIVGHSFADGPWIYDLLVAPAPRSDAGDIYARCGWNHGIQYYPHVPGDGPSGEAYHLGGFNQPMFRMLKRVIPFLNGRSLAAEWITPANEKDGAPFFATELGCGVLSPQTKPWRWKIEGGMSLNACVLGTVDRRPVALTGGADGFVIAVALADGRVVRRRHVGAPVTGVHQTTGGTIFATTRANIVRLDADLNLVGTHPGGGLRSLALGESQILLRRSDHTLELLNLPTD